MKIMAHSQELIRPSVNRSNRRRLIDHRPQLSLTHSHCRVGYRAGERISVYFVLAARDG